MAETDDHRDLMAGLINALKLHYSADRQVYVSGNLLVYYVPGNKRLRLAPDVFVARGIAKHNRDYYLVWEEGKAPEVVIELTSRSTRREDTGRKLNLYRDTLKVREYFLFDPHREYLQPQLQGHRLSKGEYRPIKLSAGRLPSKVLNLHLEADGGELRLYDPTTGQWLPTPDETRQQSQQALLRAEQVRLQAEQERNQAEQGRLQAEQIREHAEQARQQANIACLQAEQARQQAEAENERLRQELQVLRRRLSEES
jgi:Uma2 family endonuclease